MRGTDHEQSGMSSYLSAERRVPKDHALRPLRVMVDGALKALGPRFDTLYATERAAIDCSGEAVAGAFAASLFGVNYFCRWH